MKTEQGLTQWSGVGFRMGLILGRAASFAKTWWKEMAKRKKKKKECKRL